MAESWGEIETEIQRRGETYDLNRLLRPPPKHELEWETHNIHRLTNDQISEVLSYTGSWLGYLNAELGALDATLLAVKNSTTLGVSKAMAQLERDAEKRRLKDGLYAEAVGSSDELRASKWREIELEALVRNITGYRDAYLNIWQTASREQSRRTGELERGFRGQK
jgi:hypothetical protein